MLGLRFLSQRCEEPALGREAEQGTACVEPQIGITWGGDLTGALILRKSGRGVSRLAISSGLCCGWLGTTLTVLASESRPLAVSGTHEWPHKWSEATERQKQSSRLRVSPARVATGGTVSGLQGSPFLPFLSQSFHLQSLLQFSMDVKGWEEMVFKEI